MAIQKQTANSSAMRWIVIAAIAGIAFLASNRYAIAANSSKAASSTASPVAAAGGCGMSGGSGAAAGGSGAAAAGGGGCCGGGGPSSTKQAEVSGDVQKISVDVSQGYYNPDTIELKAGVPAEITFSQGSGCLGQVQSQELGFYEDLTAGPKTVKVAALQAGTYSFTCGMQMVSGTIVVK